MAGNEGGTTGVTLNHLQGFLAQKVVVIFLRGVPRGESGSRIYIQDITAFHPFLSILAPLGAFWPYEFVFWGSKTAFRRASFVWCFFASFFVRFLVQLGSILVCKRELKSIQNRSEIEVKIDPFCNASWASIFGGFWWILGIGIEASWLSKSSPKRCYLQKVIFWKNLIFPKENEGFWRFGGWKLGPKIEQKLI